MSDVRPECLVVLGLVHLDQGAVVVQGDGGRDPGIEPPVSLPGHHTVGAAPTRPVPEIARAGVVHFDDLAVAVDRDSRV